MSEPRSKYFRMSEWDGAHHLATPYPRQWIARWLKLATVADAGREELGPLFVTWRSGGFRNKKHNRAIKGARRSRHMKGDAADLYSKKWPARYVHDTFLALHKAGKIRLGGLGLYPNFVHIDTRPSKRLHRWKGKRVLG